MSHHLNDCLLTGYFLADRCEKATTRKVELPLLYFLETSRFGWVFQDSCRTQVFVWRRQWMHWHNFPRVQVQKIRVSLSRVRILGSAMTPLKQSEELTEGCTVRGQTKPLPPVLARGVRTELVVCSMQEPMYAPLEVLLCR